MLAAQGGGHTARERSRMEREESWQPQNSAEPSAWTARTHPTRPEMTERQSKDRRSQMRMSLSLEAEMSTG